MAAGDFAASPRPTPTTITGERGPEQVSTLRKVVDMDDKIVYYVPSQAPFKLLMQKAKKSETTTQWIFNWMEQDEYPRNISLSVAALAADTSLTLAAGQGTFVVSQAVLEVKRTGEQILVNAAAAADVLGTVVRAIGNVPATDLLVGEELYITAAIFADGADKGELRSVREDVKENFTEIVRTIYGVTGRGQNTTLYGGKDLTTTRLAMGIEHAKELEYRYFFGQKGTRTGSSGHVQSFTNGIRGHLTSNVWDLNGVRPTSEQFDSFAEEGMRWGQGGYESGSGMAKKFFFHGARWNAVINSWGRDKVRLVPEDKTYGLKINKYLTPFGEVLLVHSPTLDRFDIGSAFLLDLNHLKIRIHQGRGTKLLTDRQNPGVDGYEEELLTDSGMQVQLEGAHAFVFGAV